MSMLSRLEGQEGAEGAEGAGGYSASSLFPGYRSGVSSPASTLLPGVDPPTAAAVMRSREALHHAHARIAWDPKRPSTNLPTLGDDNRIERWSVEIRLTNFMTELMRPLRISADSKDESYRVVHRTAGDDWEELPLVTIIRPFQSLFEGQVQMVVDYTALRSERLQEIITQIGIPIQFWAAIMDLNPTTTRYTLELLSLGYTFAWAITQPCKHTLGVPRPENFSPSVQPVINPRRFGAFPSGHATEAFLTARLLQLVSKQKAPKTPGGPKEPKLEEQLQRLAMRIAINRTVAGVHFPIDSTAGRMLGETLATYLAYRCGNAANRDGWIERTFNGQPKKANGSVVTEWNVDFNRHDVLDSATADAPFFQDNTGNRASDPNPRLWPIVAGGKSLLAWLWKKAQAEWT